jgi:hypothetical protein
VSERHHVTGALDQRVLRVRHVLPDDVAITGFLAAIAAGLWWGAFQPPPPGLPTIRAWQRRHALSHLDWVRERLA